MAEILVKPVELKSISNDLRRGARDIHHRVEEIDTILKSLGPSRFEGERSDALRDRYSRIRDQILSFKGLVTKFAVQLDETASRFSAADKV